MASWLFGLLRRPRSWSVPSLSNTATRSAGGRYRGSPSVVALATKSVIARVVGVSRHEAKISRLFAALSSDVARQYYEAIIRGRVGFARRPESIRAP